MIIISNFLIFLFRIFPHIYVYIVPVRIMNTGNSPYISYLPTVKYYRHENLYRCDDLDYTRRYYKAKWKGIKIAFKIFNNKYLHDYD